MTVLAYDILDVADSLCSRCLLNLCLMPDHVVHSLKDSPLPILQQRFLDHVYLRRRQQKYEVQYVRLTRVEHLVQNLGDLTNLNSLFQIEK